MRKEGGIVAITTQKGEGSIWVKCILGGLFSWQKHSLLYFVFLSFSLFFIYCNKHNDHSTTWRGKDLLLLPVDSVSLSKVRAETPDQNLMERTQRSAVYCLVCLMSPRPTCPWVTPPTVGWALSHQSPVRKMPHMCAHSPACWETFLE